MDIEHEVQNLQSADAEIRTELARLTDQIAAMQQQLASLSEQFADLTQQIQPSQQLPAPPTKNLELFRSRLRELLRYANLKQADLAEKISMNPNVLSDRLQERKGYALSDSHIKSIIAVLLRSPKSAIGSRADAEELLHYAGYPGYTDQEWVDLATETGQQLTAIDEVTRAALQNDLLRYDKAQMLSQIESRRYSIPKLRRFILDISITMGLRMQCLDLLFSSAKDRTLDTELIIAIQRDPFRDLRIRSLKSIAEHQVAIESRAIIAALESRNVDNDIILNASRAARYSVINQGMEPEILIHKKFVHHKEWGVKSNAVMGIIESSPEHAFTLLQHFKKTVVYFKTRDAIARYIESRYDAGTLRGHDFSIAVDMLQSFIADGHSSDQRLKRLHALLEKISAWANQE